MSNVVNICPLLPYDAPNSTAPKPWEQPHLGDVSDPDGIVDVRKVDDAMSVFIMFVEQSSGRPSLEYCQEEARKIAGIEPNTRTYHVFNLQLARWVIANHDMVEL